MTTVSPGLVRSSLERYYLGNWKARIQAAQGYGTLASRNPESMAMGSVFLDYLSKTKVRRTCRISLAISEACVIWMVFVVPVRETTDKHRLESTVAVSQVRLGSGIVRALQKTSSYLENPINVGNVSYTTSGRERPQIRDSSSCSPQHSVSLSFNNNFNQSVVKRRYICHPRNSLLFPFHRKHSPAAQKTRAHYVWASIIAGQSDAGTVLIFAPQNQCGAAAPDLRG